MRYRKRNSDGSFGDWIDTEEVINQELLAAYEALAHMDQELEKLKREIQVMKGGEKA